MDTIASLKTRDNSSNHNNKTDLKSIESTTNQQSVLSLFSNKLQLILATFKCWLNFTNKTNYESISLNDNEINNQFNQLEQNKINPNILSSILNPKFGINTSTPSTSKSLDIAQYDGLNSLIEEGGNNLSVGERQLLVLARAMLTKSKV